MTSRRLKLCIVVLLFLNSSAQQCPTVKWLQDRIVPVNSNGVTFASEIEKDDSLKLVLSQILDHFKFLGEQKDSGVPKSDVVRDGVKNPWRCERNEDRLTEAVRHIMKNFGWFSSYPDKYIKRCRSVIKSDDADFNRKMKRFNSPSQLYDRITEFGSGVSDFAKEVGQAYGLDWDRFLRVEERPFSADRFRKCRLVKALGYRVNGRWSLAVRISNTEVGFEQEDRQRKTINEFVSTDGSSQVVNEPVTIPSCSGGLVSGYVTGTAAVSSWDGMHTWSHFANFPTEQNPAIEDALDRSEFNKELVEDINNPSSFLALWLPTILVMIPLALFQDWDPNTSIFYRIVTDFIAVLPFAAKGIELIVNGSKRTYSTVSYVYGADTSSDLAAAETWVAFCEMRAYVMGVGIFCLILIAVQIIIGILLERRARKRLQRYVFELQEESKQSNTGNFDDNEVKDNSIPSHKITNEALGEAKHSMFVSRGNGLLWHMSKARFEKLKP